MTNYATKTCNFCGIKKPANQMTRVQKTSSTKIKNSVTTRDVIGTLVGSKTSQRSLNKALFSGGGRTATRITEVWSCYKCAGYESSEERSERLKKEKELKKQQEFEERRIINENNKNEEKVRKLKRSIRVNDNTINERINNYIEVINNKELNDKDKNLLTQSAKEILKKSLYFKKEMRDVVKYDKKNKKIDLRGAKDLWTKINPEKNKYFPGRNELRNTAIILISLPSIWLIHKLIIDLVPKNQWLLSTILFSAIAILWKKYKNYLETPSKNAHQYGLLLADLEDELQAAHINAHKNLNRKFNESISKNNSFINEVEDFKKNKETIKKVTVDENKNLFKEMISTGKEIEISELILQYHIANIDEQLSVEEDREIISKVTINDANINLARKLYSDKSNVERVIKFLNIKLDVDNKKKVISNLITIAESDSIIHDSEISEIKKIAKTWGLQTQQITRTLNKKKKELSIVDSIDESDYTDIIDELF